MRAAFMATLMSLLAGCGSALVGPEAPGTNSPAVFGYYESGAVIEGWVLVTDDRIGCHQMLDVLDRSHRAGDAIWIALEKGPSLDWEGLYPGTFGSYPEPPDDDDSAGDDDDDTPVVSEGRHAEVYFQQGQDIAVLTGNDVWVWVDAYEHGTLRLVLNTELAEGIVVAKDCGELE